MAELPEGTEEYDNYVQKTAEALDIEPKHLAFAHAFDIALIDPATGEHYQPAMPVSVSVKLLKEDVSEAETVNVVHFPEDEAGDAEILDAQVVDGAVAFDGASFSIYVVSAPTHTITYELYLDKDFKQPYSFNEQQGTGDNPISTNRIIVKNGDILKFPAQPTVADGINDFRGWFTADDVEVVPGEVSGITKTETVKLYALDGDAVYVVFHEDKAKKKIIEGTGNEVEREYWPISETAKLTLGSDRKATINLNGHEPKIVTDDEIFVGWSQDSDFETEIRPVVSASNIIEPASTYDETTGELTLTGSVNLYPVYKKAVLVRFYTGESGSGASYISSAKLAIGSPLAQAKPLMEDGNALEPAWAGYTFLGWTTAEKIDENGELDYGRLIHWPAASDVDNKPVSSGNYFTTDEWDTQTIAAPQVNESIMLYAVWKANDKADYNVVAWYQSIYDDKNTPVENRKYVYASSKTVNGDSGSLVNMTTEANADAVGFATPEGYSFARGESASIEPDGTTVINLYYDRLLYTVTVKPGRYYDKTSPSYHDGGYVETSAKTGTLYGLIDTSGSPVEGNMAKVQYKFAGWQFVDTETYPSDIYGNLSLKVWKDRLITPAIKDCHYCRREIPTRDKVPG